MGVVGKIKCFFGAHDVKLIHTLKENRLTCCDYDTYKIYRCVKCDILKVSYALAGENIYHTISDEFLRQMLKENRKNNKKIVHSKLSKK